MNECPHRKKCSGCQLQNLEYEEQLHMKTAKLIALLSRYGHVEEVLPMADPYHYRNKMQAAFMMRDGKLLSGIYQSATGRIVPIDSCLLENEKADEIVVTIRKLSAGFKIKAFDPKTGRGFLRHVLVRTGFSSGEIMVVLVTAPGAFPSKRSFTNELLRRHPEITTVVWNVNTSETVLMLGRESETLYGEGYIADKLCGLSFRISPRSFYQVNPVQTEVLYHLAGEMAALSGNERILDAYCGTGTIGLTMAKNARELVGVELSRDAVRDARENAKRNGVTNAKFFAGDAGEYMMHALEAGEKFDVVVTDPPRAGCSSRFLHSLLKLSPKRVVYISCNPETLARDLNTLTRGGYRVRKIQPVDMFPFTNHVESVVCLTRK